MTIQPRYDKEKGIYRDCKFCGGRGCVVCPAEADRAYTEAFPRWAKPIATFKLNDPKDLKRFEKYLEKLLHRPEGQPKLTD